ncbi:MAG: E3 binding domain-containing protein, partial [Candidatus Methanoperedens sp.]|nr:E3 binding domain-containing protein [Candidatus Methanoperedens sp.]
AEPEAKPTEVKPEAKPTEAKPEIKPQPEQMPGRVLAVPSTRRLARELGVDISKVKGTGPGGRITDDDVRKVTEAPQAPETRPLEAVPVETAPEIT